MQIDNPRFRGSPWFDITTFGGKGDNSTDNTAAFNAAVAAAAAQTVWSGGGTLGGTVFIPPGTFYLNSPPAPIPSGVSILGCGSGQSWLVANYNETTDTNGFLTYDGHNGASRQSIQGILIFKGATGQTGGTAIKLTGTDTAHRAGFVTIRDVGINVTFGSGTGWWHHFFIADGSLITDPSSVGVRDLYIDDCYWAGSKSSVAATYTNYAVVFNNAAHVYINGLVTFVPVSPDTLSSMLVTGPGGVGGQTNNFYATNCELIGSLAFDQVTNAVFSGSCSGTFSDTANTTGTTYLGFLAGAPTRNGATTILAGGSSRIVLGGSLATGGNIQATTGAVIAGSAPSNVAPGYLATSTATTTGTLEFGSDGNCLIRRNNGSGAGTNIAITIDGFSTIPFNLDNSTGLALTVPVKSTTHTLTSAAPTVSAGQVGLGSTHATTVGAAGGATALPATPLGYIIANVDGTQVKIPYFNN